jgi:carboxyl-terminal processing protease
MSGRPTHAATSGRRRLRTGLGVVVVLLLVFAGGLVVGAASSRPAEGSAAHPGVLDEAAARIAAQAEHPVDQSTLERAAVEGMLKALGDRWSSYYSPSEAQSFSDALEGRYTGVGLWIRQTATGGVTVASVQPSSSAAAADIDPGDEIVAVAGRPVAGQQVTAITAQLRGSDGSTVSVEVRHDGALRTVVLARRQLAAGDVVVDRLAHSVLLIRVAAFTRGVGREVRDALTSEPADHSGGVVLDLRGDPGGLVDEAVEVAGAFLDGGTVVSYTQRGSGDHVLTAARGGDTTTALVVLVDGGTASAAEIVAGALQDRDRAVVVGSKTFGKGSVQEPTTLSDGSALELTVGSYATPSGRHIDGVGIDPDVTVDADAAPSVAEARALGVLAGLRAALSSAGKG